MAWCRMKFKPKKSRSLSVRKCKIDALTIFTVANQQIPMVSQGPVRSLERWYDSYMKGTKRGLETKELDTERDLAHGVTLEQPSHHISARSPALKRKSGTVGKERGPHLSAMPRQADYRECLEFLQNRPLTGAIHMEAY